MCWDSDINWAGLEDQRLALEAKYPGSKPTSPVLCQEHWDSRWASRASKPKYYSACGAMGLPNPSGDLVRR